jgi:VanZ family protein
MRALPLLIISGLIFYLSSRSSTALHEVVVYNVFLNKLAHLIAYATLFLSAVFYFQSNKYTRRHYYLYSFLYLFLYAISDEVHQTFVPSRQGKISDVFIDLLGGVIAYFSIKILHRYLRISNLKNKFIS